MRVLKPQLLFLRRSSFAIMSLAFLAVSGLTGCQKLGLKAPDWNFNRLLTRSQTPDDDEDDFEDDFETKLDIPMVGDYVTFSGLN